MKKLMIALGVIAMAVAANATVVNWNSGVIYVATDDKGTTGSSAAAKANTGTRLVKSYIYELADATEYEAALEMDTLGLWYEYAGAQSQIGTKGTNAGGQANYAQTVSAASGKHYVVAIFVDEGTETKAPKGTQFIKAGVYQANVGAAMDITVSNMIGSAKSTTWTPTPEPTSGLLLLLGVAGLALRRKQK